MNSKKFSEAMSELDTKYVDEAINYQKKATKSYWAKLGIIAACLCFVIIAVISVPAVIKPDESEGGGAPMTSNVGNSEGGGTPITSESNNSIPEVTPVILAQYEIIEEMKTDLVNQDIQSWTELPNTMLNFEHVIPIYYMGNVTESSSKIIETLMFDNQYMIPAMSNGECVGACTVLQYEGKWTIGAYEKGLDIETEIKLHKDSAICFMRIPQLNGEYGFLVLSGTEEEYTPLPGFVTSDTMKGEQVLEKIKNNMQIDNSDFTDG